MYTTVLSKRIFNINEKKWITSYTLRSCNWRNWRVWRLRRRQTHLSEWVDEYNNLNFKKTTTTTTASTDTDNKKCFSKKRRSRKRTEWDAKRRRKWKKKKKYENGSSAETHKKTINGRIRVYSKLIRMHSWKPIRIYCYVSLLLLSHTRTRGREKGSEELNRVPFNDSLFIFFCFLFLITRIITYNTEKVFVYRYIQYSQQIWRRCSCCFFQIYKILRNDGRERTKEKKRRRNRRNVLVSKFRYIWEKVYAARRRICVIRNRYKKEKKKNNRV